MTASELTPKQQKAVARLDKNTLVTAGAGSGKTRTLVARYLELLNNGSLPRRVAAITFTEKAAREMRNRVREAVAAQVKAVVKDGEKERWEDVLAAMDSARIGTIHSLCAEILRTHPAEAKVDPEFEVVDEGIALALRAQAIEDVLAWATDQADIAPIFEAFKTMALERLLQFLMARRLEADPLLADVNVLQRMYQEIGEELKSFIKTPEVADIIESWRDMERSGRLAEDAGKKLTDCISELLAAWCEVEESYGSGNSASNVTEIAAALFNIRRRYLKRGIGKKDSEAKRMHARLQSIYDESLDPWLGGKKKGDDPPELNIEFRYQEDLPRLKELFVRAVSAYRGSLEARYALDFDDLEAGALMLLKQPEIQRRWQQNLSAILVDEFQDTNNRQRDIIEALCGDEPGRLFVVGDARQSIYRFRGADVTVFRRMESTVVEEGGETVELDLTFRAHKQLLDTIEGLLEPVLHSEGKKKELFQTPFNWLSANRKQPALDIRPPYVEIISGIGENADEARPQAAKALIRRLIEMKNGGQFQSWEDVAFLFRASTGFGAYEDALEALNVPFVTVAGRGFYDRPEIRDVLNIMHVLEDPHDDLAMAGMMRSPAIGISDEAIYRLRWQNGTTRPLLEALANDLSELDPEDQECALRAGRILNELLPLVDRMPVAELLKRLIDILDYRAVLATSHSRRWRNLDKLLADAHASRLVRMSEFLEYLQTLRDVGAREGEAPAEAQGAVRLMTIHKAKGLEFEIVVLADASRRIGSRSSIAYLVEQTGLAFKPDRIDGVPLAYRLAQYLDKRRDEAEEQRLLYVAATRAKEKLLISGHLKHGRKGGWQAAGWLKAVIEKNGVAIDDLADKLEMWHEHKLSNGMTVGVWIGSPEIEGKAEAMKRVEWPTLDDDVKSLYKLLDEPTADQIYKKIAEEIERDWRATGERIHAPAAAVGQMVHKAIERWIFTEDEGIYDMLETAALKEGLVDNKQRLRAVHEAQKLLKRLRDDPGWVEIDKSIECYHELPYARMQANGKVDAGKIDLLYRAEKVWKLVDFKTDEITDEIKLKNKINEYRPQLAGYTAAVKALMSINTQVSLCFLDYNGTVKWVQLD